jgi:hypothetical protein
VTVTETSTDTTNLPRAERIEVDATHAHGIFILRFGTLDKRLLMEVLSALHESLNDNENLVSIQFCPGKHWVAVAVRHEETDGYLVLSELHRLFDPAVPYTTCSTEDQVTEGTFRLVFDVLKENGHYSAEEMEDSLRDLHCVYEVTRTKNVFELLVKGNLANKEDTAKLEELFGKFGLSVSLDSARRRVMSAIFCH